MNRFFAFLLLLAVGFVAAQNERLCDINFLRSLKTSNATSSTDNSAITGDFVCSTSNESLSLLPEDVTIPASKNLDDSSTVDIPPLDPSLILIFEKANLTGVFNGSSNNGSTIFNFLIALPPNETTSSVIADISYDFNGDTLVDRLEVYDQFNVTPGTNTTEFKSYKGDSSSIPSTQGTDFQNFTNGSIRLRLWSNFGGSTLLLKTGGSSSTNATSTNATSTNDTSTISFPYTWGNETGTGTGGSGGGTGGSAECCDEIASLQTELDSLKTQLDSFSSRLLNITRNCCTNTTTTGTTSAGTTSASGTATVAETATAVATETVAETA